MPAFLWSYLLIVLLAQPKPVLTGIQIYDLLGRDTGTRQFQAFDRRMGTCKVMPGNRGQDLYYKGVDLSLDADSTIVEIRIYPPAFQGGLPFGLKDRMPFEELLAIYPGMLKAGEFLTCHHDPESCASFVVDAQDRVTCIYFSLPDGYCTTRDLHFDTLGKDASLPLAGESEADHLARMQRDEAALLASLSRNTVLLKNMKALNDHVDSQKPWSPIPPFRLGAYDVKFEAYPIYWEAGGEGNVSVPAREQETFPVGLENAEVQVLRYLNEYTCFSQPPAPAKLLHGGKEYVIKRGSMARLAELAYQSPLVPIIGRKPSSRPR